MFSRAAVRLSLCSSISLLLLGVPSHSAAQINQWLKVDCSGGTPGAYGSINSALPFLMNGVGIYVVPGTTCTESVTFDHLENVALTTNYLSSFNLAGGLTIATSRNVYIQGVNVTNSAGNGISVDGSYGVALDQCSSKNNSGRGLDIYNASQVSVTSYGTFSFNGAFGIGVSGGSQLTLFAWGGPMDISGNRDSGLVVDRANVGHWGNTTITNNLNFGIDVRGGGATGTVFAALGPALISSNVGGGIHVGEASEVSMGGGASWASSPITVQANGPYGVVAEFGSQITLWGTTQVLDHTTAGIDAYGNSQVAVLDGVQVSHNGLGTDAGRAGIRVDGGSQASVRGATISQNGGPGVLGLANSSLDVAGSTFSSNAAGAVLCDGSASLVTDLASSILGSGNSCKIPTASGVRRNMSATFSAPDWRREKDRIDKMHAITANLHR